LTVDKGYVSLNRTWKRGDVIQLHIPMPVRRVIANDQVTADRGRIAIQRGPLVYAAEWVDNPGGKVRNLMLPDDEKLTSEYRPELLNGVVVVRGKAVSLAHTADGKLTQHEQEFTAVPYYAWANRGRGQMIVWIPDTQSSAKPAPIPTLATDAKVTSSGRKNSRAVNDGEEPKSSSDADSYFDWWPKKGSTEWIEYDFANAVTVAESELYWFDDTGRGEVRVPQSWRILYRDGEEWKPVENLTSYGIAKDTYNKVEFKPVTTPALRLEVQMQPNWSAGVEKWKVR
jgi:hypothetical protein